MLFSNVVGYLILSIGFRVLALNTFETCRSKSKCISMTTDGMKNLVAQMYSTQLKLIDNMFICNASAPICQHQGEKIMVFGKFSL